MGLTLVAALVYACFVLNPLRHGDLVPYVALVLAESILLLNAIAMWLTALAQDPDDPELVEVYEERQALLDGRSSPSIDVLITVCGEPLALVEETVRAAVAMRVPHRTWVCDDGPSDELDQLCSTMGVGYLRRGTREGVKAGNVNAALRRTSGEFVVLLDADHVAHPDLLLVLLPHLARPTVGFVQGPQTYSNHATCFTAAASAESQRVFYEVICPGKNRFNAAFHVGTNAVFRRSALEDVGGFYEDTLSEDIWTSVRLHQRGWDSVYVPEIVALGLAPDTVSSHFRQQFRWASGSFEILLRSNPLSVVGLAPGQRLQYLTPPLHFLLGFSNLWFLTLPPLYLLFGITPLHADSGTWLTWFLPFYVLTQLVLWLQSGGFRPKPIALSVATAPVHVAAFLNVLLKRAAVWRVSNTGAAPPAAVEFLLPQIALFLLNATAVVVGLLAVQNVLTTSITVALCLLHLLVLGKVILEAVLDRSRGRRRVRREQIPAPRLAPAVIDLRDVRAGAGEPA